MNLRDVDEAVVAETIGRGWERWHGEAAWVRQRVRWPANGHGFNWRADQYLGDAVANLCIARTWRKRGEAMFARGNAAASLTAAAAYRRAAVINRQIARQSPELA